jgi:death-on-curing family protein
MKSENSDLGEIVIYTDGDTPYLEVTINQDTVWLTQAQLVDLYQSSKANISEHIKHILEEEELKHDSVVRKFRITASDGKKYETEHYNLDMIISLGYRIKSKVATKFRIWATNVLKEYTLKGVAVNQKRLNQLGTYLDIVSRSEISEVAGVGEIVKGYIDALHLLEDYDENTLSEPKGDKECWQLTYKEARAFLNVLKTNENFGDNFSLERNEHFIGIISGLYQTFDSKELYESIQEKAANLLYQIVKDHPFLDGNKRSGAALFIYFLAKNGALRNINSNALAAITLMTALSTPNEKEQIILLIRNFLSYQSKTSYTT